MKRIEITIYAALLIYLVSCTDKINKEYNSGGYKLSYEKTITFKLDSLTLPYSESFQFVDIQDTSYMTFLNKEKKTIYFYNYETCLLDHILHINHEQLPRGYGIDGHFIQSSDSIILLNYELAILYLANSNGTIINKYSLERDFALAKHPPNPELGSFNPIKIFDNKIYCSGYITGEYNDEKNARPLLIVYDLTTGDISYHIEYPEKYLFSNWGEWHYRRIFCSFTGNKLVFSFPASTEIYYIENINTLDLKSNLPPKQIQINPLCKDKDYSPTKSEITKHHLENYYYGPIISDIYNNLYYRIKYFPKKKYDIANWRTWERSFSIEIFDNKLKKCGEHYFSEETFIINAIFVTREGLNIRKIDGNEDKLTFQIFKPKIS